MHTVLKEDIDSSLVLKILQKERIYFFREYLS